MPVSPRTDSSNSSPYQPVRVQNISDTDHMVTLLKKSSTDRHTNRVAEDCEVHDEDEEHTFYSVIPQVGKSSRLTTDGLAAREAQHILGVNAGASGALTPVSQHELKTDPNRRIGAQAADSGIGMVAPHFMNHRVSLEPTIRSNFHQRQSSGKMNRKLITNDSIKPLPTSFALQNDGSSFAGSSHRVVES